MFVVIHGSVIKKTEHTKATLLLIVYFVTGRSAYNHNFATPLDTWLSKYLQNDDNPTK